MSRAEVIMNVYPAEFYAHQDNAHPTKLENVFVLPDAGQVVIVRPGHCLAIKAQAASDSTGNHPSRAIVTD